MHELIQFFIDQASISGEHLAGMLFAAVVVISILGIIAYQLLELVLNFLKRLKPINIKKVEKVEKIVEVPKYVDNKVDYQEIIKRLKAIEEKQNQGVNL